MLERATATSSPKSFLQLSRASFRRLAPSSVPISTETAADVPEASTAANILHTSAMEIAGSEASSSRA